VRHHASDEPAPKRSRGRGVNRSSVRAVWVFAVLGAAWVVMTNAIIHVNLDGWPRFWAQTTKGLVFVVASSLFVAYLMRGFGRQRDRSDASARETDDALRHSETRYQALVERVPGVVWLNEIDPSDPKRTRCVYVAPQLEFLLGYTPEEWMADEDLWRRVIHPHDLPRVLKEHRLADSKGALSMEYRALHRDGGIVWIHDEAVLIPADGDRPACWQGVMVDITTQRIQGEALRDLSESLRAVFEASPLGIIALEKDGRVRHWNPAAERMLGWTAREVVGQPIPYVPPDKQEEFEELVRRELSGESIAGFETQRLRKDGSRLDVSISIAPLIDAEDQVNGVLGVVEDITERRRVAGELANRQRQQEAVAGLGLLSLTGGDLQSLLDEAACVAASTLGLEIAGIFELPPEEEALVLRVGTGWLGTSPLIEVHESTLGTYALNAGEPVVVEDLHADDRFSSRALLLEHGVVSGVATAVFGATRPLGVLEVLSEEPRIFSRDDVRFLQGIAAIVGHAIERGRSSAALATAEAKYRGLVERGPGVVYLTDPVMIPSAPSYVSPQVVDMLGYPAEAWTRNPRFWTTILHPEDRERVLETEARSIQAGEPFELEYRFLASDGREVWVHDKATILEAPDGTPLVRQGLFVDVTGRRRAEEERRRSLDRQLRLASRLELLHQIDRDVLSSASIGEMAARTLDQLRRLVPYDRGSVAVLDQETGRFTDVAVRSPGVTMSENVESYVPDEVARELLSRDVLLVRDLAEFDAKTPYVIVVRELGIRSCLTVALGLEEGQVGSLALSSKTVDAFDEESVDIAREVGSELAVAIRQTRMRETLAERAGQLERLAEERQQMLHRIVRAQEEERERVALELHDGLGQVLTSISLFASELEDAVPPEARPRAVRVNELIRRAIVDSRRLVWSLRPPELERLGLVPALRRLAEEVCTPDVTVDLHEDIGSLRLAQETEAVVYRVVQEAVHNAQKHASASAISILLHRYDGTVSAFVEDNGCGFDPHEVPTGRGLGLVGMRERAELVEGNLVVESAVEAGTRIRLEVPMRGSEVP
jgi:PAS domain S-box-containing protein